MPNVQFDSSDTYIVRTSQMIYYVPWTVGGGWCLLPWRLLDTCCNGNAGAQGPWASIGCSPEYMDEQAVCCRTQTHGKNGGSFVSEMCSSFCLRGCL